MTIARGAATPRRTPVPADRYRRAVRHAQARLPRRRRLPTVAAALFWIFLLAGAGTIAIRVAGGVSVVAGDLGSFVADLVPPARSIDIPLSDPNGSIAAAPIFDPTPDFVAMPALLLQGRVPSFEIVSGRHIEVTVNDGPSAFAQIDANGHFAVPITLKDGPNGIIVALLADREIVVTTSRMIVLDRLPPALGIAKPKTGDVIDGSSVTVEGKAEPYAAVTVNDRNVVVSADGSFSESFTAPFGPLAITVVAKDRAGNETRSVAMVVVRDKTAAGTVTLFVALDKPAVKPGQLVTATITLSDPSGPRGDTSVSLSVGVVPIGTTKTDRLGKATISFAAPPNDGVAQVVVLGAGVWGSATLAVAR